MDIDCFMALFPTQSRVFVCADQRGGGDNPAFLLTSPIVGPITTRDDDRRVRGTRRTAAASTTVAMSNHLTFGDWDAYIE